MPVIRIELSDRLEELEDINTMNTRKTECVTPQDLGASNPGMLVGKYQNNIINPIDE